MGRAEAEAEAGGVPTRASHLSPLIAGFWLVLLVNPLLGHTDHEHDLALAVAYAAMVPFCLVYLWLLRTMRDLPLEARGTVPPVKAWGGIVVLLGLCAVTAPGWGQDAVNLTAFPVLAAALVLPTRQAVVFVPVVAVAAYALTLTVPGWENDINVPLVLLGAGFVMGSLRQAVVSNIDLIRMRHEYRGLLLEQERNRFARDLHDLLGHSLTLITVKAELAARLLEAGADERGVAEVRDLERLSREALGDVREAVHGYHAITLPGEISRARMTLAAAGIESRLPSSADDVAGPLRELFAWAIREGVTNVVRHSGATWCSVEVSADRVVVANDLPHVPDRCGGPELLHGDGNGLVGLRERAQAAGACLRVRMGPSDFSLEVGST